MSSGPKITVLQQAYSFQTQQRALFNLPTGIIMLQANIPVLFLWFVVMQLW